jgi:hypothetical protein
VGSAVRLPNRVQAARAERREARKVGAALEAMEVAAVAAIAAAAADLPARAAQGDKAVLRRSVRAEPDIGSRCNPATLLNLDPAIADNLGSA